MQTLIMWALVARGGEAAQKELVPPLSKPQREALVKLGLLHTRKGPRNAMQVELTDRGWGWLATNMTAPLSARSPSGTAVLAGMLARLAAFLAARDLALADFIRPAPPAPAPRAEQPEAAPAERIRAAYLAATGGQVNRQLRLAELRPALADLGRDALDAALLGMEQAGHAGLLPFDDPTEIRAEDREAALLVGGRPRHLLWLDR
jgi:hypothetical protein